MKYKYIAAQQDGKRVDGQLDAASVAEALSILAAKKMTPITLKELEGKAGSLDRALWKSSINLTDKIFLTKYLSLMLRIGTDLFGAIDIFIADLDKPVMKSFLKEIRQNLEKGLPFYYSFAKRPESFSPVFINLIKAGETSGKLEEILERLSVGLQKEQELKHEIKSALVYPIMLIVVALLVVFFLATFALPKISKLFVDSSVTPPLFSRIVFTVGDFLNANLIAIIITLAVTIVTVWILAMRSGGFRRFVVRVAHKVPMVGGLLKKIAIQRFATTLSSLLSSGLKIVESIDITATVVGDHEMKEALTRISHEGIMKGLTVGESFKKEPIFPAIISNMVAISEKSGNLASILNTFGEFYDSEIRVHLKALISLLEPVLLIFIAITVGTIALATIIPIYQLIGNF